MSPSRAVVRVPASTSNLGPGFDCLGLALQLHNTVQISRSDKAPSTRGMVAQTATAFFERAAIEPFAFETKIEGAVPVSRGLGSSVTVRCGVLLALNEVAGAKLKRGQLLDLVIELEGHPDNAVASFLGGFAVCAPASEGKFTYTRVEVGPELNFVTLVPELKLSTEAARALLPREVSLRHAVENAQRTAKIASLFCIKDYEALRGLFIDHLHQPFRRILIPGFDQILQSASDAGALGSFLSGAGSCLMALTLNDGTQIGKAMQTAAKQAGLESRVLILQADNVGAQLI